MRRVTIIVVLTAFAVLAIAAGANAATTNPDGSITVTKGEIQAAMKWNDADWLSHLNDLNDIPSKFATSGGGAEPVYVPGGWWTLNGQLAENEYFTTSFTDASLYREGCQYGPVTSYTTDGGASSLTVDRVYNGGKDPKVIGFKVSASPYVDWTRHQTQVCPDGTTGAEYNVTMRWANSGGVGNVQINGVPVTVTPAA